MTTLVPANTRLVDMRSSTRATGPELEKEHPVMGCWCVGRLWFLHSGETGQEAS